MPVEIRAQIRAHSMGVPEYWIVDPEEHLVEQWVLRDGAYVLQGPHADRVTLEGMRDVTVDLGQVW